MNRIIVFSLLFLCFQFGETKAQNEIINAVEVMPEFPGGEDAMMDFIGKNLKYPKIAMEAGITGKVFISFVVDKTGKVTKAKIERDIGGNCGLEALRVVNMMPDWKPGYSNGKAVNVYFTLPFSFEEESGVDRRQLRREARKKRREARKK